MPVRIKLAATACPAGRDLPPDRGFSLVEVLVALVILSVGLLGIVGLTLQSLVAGRTAMLHQYAVLLAGDVADRIRANPHARSAYEGAVPAGHCVAAPGGCRAAAMAHDDISLWQEQAASSLPAGRVIVQVDESNTPPLYAITVNWSEPGSASPSAYSIHIPVAPR